MKDDTTGVLTGVLNIGVVKPRYYKFVPQEDITIYELSSLLPLFGINIYHLNDFIDALPDDIKRHFEEVRDESNLY